ncbi:glucose-6-phosphate isomerase [Candidatus Aerophobetes bacterium]|nr:glucose-6-phosphate isomerase [Candidatus Aerophobetes bacterium]
MKLMKPFGKQFNLTTGVIDGADNHWTRYLKEMRGMYQDREVLNEIMNSDNPLIYEVYEVSVPEEAGQLIQCTSIIYPGKIGKEYYMTKGHYHKKKSCAEVYLCFSGQGYVLLQTEDGECETVEMKKEAFVYVPPYWAHRTINVGKEPLVFTGVYPAEAGHNYGSIEKVGFAKIIVEEQGKPVIKRNPNFKVK